MAGYIQGFQLAAPTPDIPYKELFTATTAALVAPLVGSPESIPVIQQRIDELTLIMNKMANP